MHQEGTIVAVTEIVAEDMAYQEKIIIFCAADIRTRSTFFILVSDKNWENTQAP